jgi:cytidine deaminase
MARARRGEAEWDELTAAAQAASARAHAPYSNLRVGAALQDTGGGVHSGCNVENASFGLTICAERAALFRAVAEGEREFRRLVIFSPDAGPLPPCGACRQVLAEFCRDLAIVSVGRGGDHRRFQLAELLPEAFGWPTGSTQPAGGDVVEGEARPRRGGCPPDGGQGREGT